jgi:hypothetical protein
VRVEHAVVAVEGRRRRRSSTKKAEMARKRKI